MVEFFTRTSRLTRKSVGRLLVGFSRTTYFHSERGCSRHHNNSEIIPTMGGSDTRHSRSRRRRRVRPSPRVDCRRGRGRAQTVTLQGSTGDLDRRMRDIEMMLTKVAPSLVRMRREMAFRGLDEAEDLSRSPAKTSLRRLERRARVAKRMGRDRRSPQEGRLSRE